MPTAVSGTSSSTTTTGSTPSGARALTGADFLNLMIQQLQQQDPLNPTDSNQLLTQMAQISQLQSNTAMTDSLTGLTLQQSIGAGGNLIGKSVQGLDISGNPQTGVVTSVKVQDKKVYLEMDTGQELPLENVTNIAITPTTSATAAALANSGTGTSNLSGLMSLLAGLGAK